MLFRSPVLREALKAMGHAELIGNGARHLVPTYQPLTGGSYQTARRKNSTPPGQLPGATSVKASAPAPGRVLTQHTGLPPRVTGAVAARRPGAAAAKSAVTRGPKGRAKPAK